MNSFDFHVAAAARELLPPKEWAKVAARAAELAFAEAHPTVTAARAVGFKPALSAPAK
jgi:hypothetical protein